MNTLRDIPYNASSEVAVKRLHVVVRPMLVAVAAVASSGGLSDH
jgi:hypothetical protein